MDQLKHIAEGMQEVDRLTPLALDLSEVKETISNCAVCGHADREDASLERRDRDGNWLCPPCLAGDRHVGPNRAQRRHPKRTLRQMGVLRSTRPKPSAKQRATARARGKRQRAARTKQR